MDYGLLLSWLDLPSCSLTLLPFKVSRNGCTQRKTEHTVVLVSWRCWALQCPIEPFTHWGCVCKATRWNEHNVPVFNWPFVLLWAGRVRGTTGPGWCFEAQFFGRDVAQKMLAKGVLSSVLPQLTIISSQTRSSLCTAEVFLLCHPQRNAEKPKKLSNKQLDQGQDKKLVCGTFPWRVLDQNLWWAGGCQLSVERLDQFHLMRTLVFHRHA